MRREMTVVETERVAEKRLPGGAYIVCRGFEGVFVVD
jgi:hypothetical protein